MEKFTAGLLLGACVGAVVVANSYKMRVLVKKSQDEMKTRLDEMMDEKIEMLENMSAQKSEEQQEKPSASKKRKA